METVKLTSLVSPIADRAATNDAEWAAQPLRPVAHWVSMPLANGRSQLSMVWEIPNPMPPHQP
jgi:hypothetical protein